MGQTGVRRRRRLPRSGDAVSGPVTDDARHVGDERVDGDGGQGSEHDDHRDPHGDHAVQKLVIASLMITGGKLGKLGKILGLAATGAPAIARPACSDVYGR
jgi:hypothetical protein